MSASLVGMYNSNGVRDGDIAYDAMLVAIARNDRLHVNNPVVAKYGPAGGVSGYKSAKYTPEYIAQGSVRAFYDDLLGECFVGVVFLAGFVGFRIFWFLIGGFAFRSGGFHGSSVVAM